MSNRRRAKPRKPDLIVKVPVASENLEIASAAIRALTKCASCGGHAQPADGGGLHITHIGDCPAIADSRKILEANHA